MTSIPGHNIVASLGAVNRPTELSPYSYWLSWIANSRLERGVHVNMLETDQDLRWAIVTVSYGQATQVFEAGGHCRVLHLLVGKLQLLYGVHIAQQKPVLGIRRGDRQVYRS
uniref:(northern house mosquito) hypothetical protein n=1 Tax=Culex pipiens TaxID=7175 RepID=A0A8D8JL24_CULPI